MLKWFCILWVVYLDTWLLRSRCLTCQHEPHRTVTRLQHEPRTNVPSPLPRDRGWVANIALSWWKNVTAYIDPIQTTAKRLFLLLLWHLPRWLTTTGPELIVILAKRIAAQLRRPCQVFVSGCHLIDRDNVLLKNRLNMHCKWNVTARCGSCCFFNATVVGESPPT